MRTVTGLGEAHQIYKLLGVVVGEALRVSTEEAKNVFGGVNDAPREWKRG